MLLCLRALRPGLPALRAMSMSGYAEASRVAQADPDLDRFFTHSSGAAAPSTKAGSAKSKAST